MKPPNKALQSSLTSSQGQTPYNHDEIAELRRKAWKEQGLLIVSPVAPQLEPDETEFLTIIAEKLYGKEGDA